MSTVAKRRVRSAIGSVLVHDMKNVGFRLNVLASNFEEHFEDPDFRKSVVELLRATVEKIDAMVGSWSDHEDAILMKVELDLNDLVSEVIRQGRAMTRGTREKSVRIVSNLGELKPVWGDAYYLKDALSNIFQNALEAAAACGSMVEITTKMQIVNRRRVAIVEISDDGPGIALDFARDQLFRPFRTTKLDGVGLGLYTARQIVGFHHGSIDLLPRTGGGTTARITLPAGRGAGQ